MSDPAHQPGIEHVVVLMFENRSFDHMLGLLRPGDPTYGGVELDSDRFANPLDPSSADSELVRVSAAATYALPVDTPHSHGAVMHQLRPTGKGPLTMDGFVDAYRTRIVHPDANHATIRRLNVAIAVVCAVVALTAVLSLPLVIPHLIGAAGLLLAVTAAVGWLERRAAAAPVHRWRRWLAAAVAATGVLVLITAVTAQIDRWPVRSLVNLGILIVVAVMAAGIWYRRRARLEPPADGDAAPLIMACMSGDKAPALWRLAEHFAVCTSWHSSVPGATWPNRNFAHAGTSDGTVDIEVGLYEDDTIFDRLSEAGRTWRVYRDRDGLAQVMVFGRMLDPDNIANWHPLEDFAFHVAAEEAGTGSLATYSFIEPCHDGPRSNSQHPGNNDYDRPTDADGLTDFQRGEQLLVEIYETLRAHPSVFAKTVLVVTYDEHGGFYDHVPPPTDVLAPRRVLDSQGRVPRSRLPRWLRTFVRQPEADFDFRTLGVRVPTVIVSPRIPAAPDPTRYDHTAIPATLRKLFAPQSAALSDREAASATFDHLWVGCEVRTDLPALDDLRFHPAAFGALADAGPPAPTPPTSPTDLALELARLAPQVAERIGPAPAGFGPLADADAGDPDDLSPTAVGRRLTRIADAHR